MPNAVRTVQPYHGSPPKLILRQEMIESWARLRTPQRHFVTSMTDPFGAWVPRDWQHRILDGMAAAPHQTFQILTKQPELALAAITDWVERRGLPALPPHIWIGVSVGNSIRLGKKVAGRLLDDRTWDEFPAIQSTIKETNHA